MKSKIYIGRDQKNDKVFLDLNKEKIYSILLAGLSGSGKSIFHFSLYHQLLQQNTPVELGFVFFDMTKVDFAKFPYPAYLYKPIIKSLDEALDCFEELGKESKLRCQGKVDRRRSILIHIEECDLMYYDRKRFEQAWIDIASGKDKNNIYVVFSSSRCCPEVFTRTILNNVDLKILFSPGGSGFDKSLYDECSLYLFSKRFKNTPREWQRVLMTDQREILCQGYSEEEVKEVKSIF
ncbi:MAG: hypothetical protein JW991_01540 [Candidatus Pacebacteria bacterium]|nr:hypothetical protein [Candidatus Paceibacterota bacterium]